MMCVCDQDWMCVIGLDCCSFVYMYYIYSSDNMPLPESVMTKIYRASTRPQWIKGFLDCASNETEWVEDGSFLPMVLCDFQNCVFIALIVLVFCFRWDIVLGPILVIGICDFLLLEQFMTNIFDMMASQEHLDYKMNNFSKGTSIMDAASVCFMWCSQPVKHFSF